MQDNINKLKYTLLVNEQGGFIWLGVKPRICCYYFSWQVGPLLSVIGPSCWFSCKMCKRKLKVDKKFRNYIKNNFAWFFSWCSIWEMPRTCVNQWNDSEKQMTLKFLGLAEGDYKETFLFRRGDSLPLVHTTEQVRFSFLGGTITSAWYFLWGSVLSKSYHPPSDMWSTKFSLQYQAPAQCWQYTWLGAANERVNYTATCRFSNWCC